MFQVLNINISREQQIFLERNRVQFIRLNILNLKLIFDYKCKVEQLKSYDKCLQSLLKSIIYTFILDKITVNFGYLIGILNFVVFCLKKGVR